MLAPVFEQASDIVKEEYPVIMRNATSYRIRILQNSLGICIPPVTAINGYILVFLVTVVSKNG